MQGGICRDEARALVIAANGFDGQDLAELGIGDPNAPPVPKGDATDEPLRDAHRFAGKLAEIAAKQKPEPPHRTSMASESDTGPSERSRPEPTTWGR
jgi:hypothetical protein